MATTRIKEKISKIVSSQLPEFIQSDYSTFVSFIEAYYKFLEQDQGAFELIQNARSYNDLDKTTESFVQYFLKNYAQDIPVSVLANKRFLVKRIKDLYESKGSELSFKLLFNLLFQSDVNVVYPFENVLRASAGRWQQRNSVRVVTVAGDRNDILNRSLNYTYEGLDYSTPIVEVKNITSSVTELFLDPNFLAPNYTVGDTVTVEGSSGNIFTGTIGSTIVSYGIQRGGLGFKTGQVYTVNYEGGVNTLIRISNVSSVGAITEIKFISYGHSYPNRIFIVDLDPTKNLSDIGFDVLSSRTQGFGSTGKIEIFDTSAGDSYFAEDYVSETYVADIELRFFDDSVFSAAIDSIGTKSNNIATVAFTPGGLGRYEGSFASNDGFISELDIRLENDLLYQPFAYQTITDLDITTFFDIVTQLVHPAGQRMFNNRLLSQSIDLSSNVSVEASSNLFVSIHDFANIIDLIVVGKGQTLDDSNVTPTSIATLSVSKEINTSTSGIYTETLSYVTTANQDYFAEDYTDGGYVFGPSIELSLT